MKRKFRMLTCLMALLNLCSIVFAQQVSLNEAMEVARGCMTGSHGFRVKSKVAPQLAYTAERNGNVCYYVFNNGEDGGFVIVGGDQRARKVLGVVPEGSFNYNELPSNVQAWMDEYEIQIDRAIRLTPEVTMQEKEQRQARRAAKARKTSIPEMITTKWGQHEPFNNAIYSTTGNHFGTAHGRAYVTGCVATAMAQVMKFWEYPTRGEGSFTYASWKDHTLFSADFENTTYDWANMKDVYRNDEYTDEEAAAVATLMFHCGVAAEMGYNDDASSSGLPFAASGLVRNFGYSSSIYPLAKYMVSEEEFVDAVYNELKAGRPILYAGGQHVFVCHGYDAATDLYAINWGWAGMDDGYFAITGDDALTPTYVGTGGDAEGYGRGQQILCGVQPRLSDPEAEANAAPLAIANNIGWQIQRNSYIFPSYYELDLSGGDQNLTFYAELRNLTYSAKDVELCVVFEDEATGERIYTDVIQDTFWPGQQEYILRANFSTSIFQNSSLYCPYLMVRPVGQPEAEWIRTLYAFNQEFVKLNVTGRGEQHTMPLDIELVEESGHLQIKWDNNYQGEYTINSSNDDIISVSWGNYLSWGSTAGTAEITVVAEAYGYYGKTIKTFTFTNKNYTTDHFGSDFYVDDITAPNAEDVVNRYNTSYRTRVKSTMNADGGKVTFTIKNDTWNPIPAQDIHFVVQNNGYVWNEEYQAWDDASQIYVVTYHDAEWDAYESKKFTIDLTSMAPLVESHDGDPNLSITPCLGYSMESWGVNYSDVIGGLSLRTTVVPTLEIPYTLSAAGWGTVCLPYESKVPAGMEAYICSGESNGTLILEAVNTIEEKTPYITSGTPGNYTFRGPQIEENNLEDTYNRGMLTGVMKEGVQIPDNAYLLQNKDDVVAFYRYVGEAANATQYRAFLNGNKLSNGVRSACYFPGTHRPTAIESVSATTATMPAGIYDMNGRRLQQLQKGINILRMEDGSVKKLMVK